MNHHLLDDCTDIEELRRIARGLYLRLDRQSEENTRICSEMYTLKRKVKDLESGLLDQIAVAIVTGMYAKHPGVAHNLSKVYDQAKVLLEHRPGYISIQPAFDLLDELSQEVHDLDSGLASSALDPLIDRLRAHLYEIRESRS